MNGQKLDLHSFWLVTQPTMNDIRSSLARSKAGFAEDPIHLDAEIKYY